MPQLTKPGARYDMPAAYGPTVLPATSDYKDITSTAIPFVTERDAVADLVPHYFEVPEHPTVTVTHQQLCGIDFLAGRQYNVAQVLVGVTYRNGETVFNAPVHLAIWENDANSVIAGREFLGNPKLYARIPDLVPQATGAAFSCHEYDGFLLSGRTYDMQPLEGERLAKARQAMTRTTTFGWKYISGPGGVVDADYPVKVETQVDVAWMSSGRGEIAWGDPTWEQAPISSRIIARLRQIPMLEYKRSVSLGGPAKLFRGAAVRLPWPETPA